MSRSPDIGTALFNLETLWAEVSTVFGTRVQTIGNIDNSKLEQQKLAPAYTTQLRNEIKPGVNWIVGGEFEIEMKLTGHGTTTAGAVTANPLETLLGIFLGGSAVAASTSGTTATAGGTVTALNTAAASGFVAGSLVGPIGTVGDGRGNGQFSIVVSHAANVLTIATALDAALNNGDVIRNPINVFTPENPTAANAVQSTRWRFLSANLEYDCRGCYPKSYQVTGINPAGEPTVKFRFGVSFFTETATAMPDATAVLTYPHAPSANGSLVLKTKGTTTRDATTKYDCRDFTLTHTLGIKERMGHYGVNPNQVVTSCSRTRDEAFVEFVIDAPNATTTPDLVTKWAANAPLDLTYVWGAADGQGGALFSPYVVPDGNKPVQFDSGGIQSYRFRGKLGADNTKTTDIERSMLRIAQG